MSGEIKVQVRKRGFGSNGAGHRLTVTVSNRDANELDLEAAYLGVPTAALARTFISEGLTRLKATSVSNNSGLTENEVSIIPEDDSATIPNHWLDDLVGLKPLVDSSYRREPFPYRGWSRFWHCVFTAGLLSLIPWGLIIGLMIKLDAEINLFLNPVTVMLVCAAPLFLHMFCSKSEYG